MSREIKFRAWDKATRHMIAEGFHVIGEVTMFGMIKTYLYENMCGAESSLLRLNDVELMQFIGLKDKNGKEIYEGDIVKGGPFMCRKSKIKTSSIVYRHNGFWVDMESFGWEGEDLWDWDQLKVIGNIYENPELLSSLSPARS